MGDMRRSNERFKAHLSVRLHDDRADAIALNISADSVFIITNAVLVVRKTIRFSIEFQDTLGPHGQLYLECFGEVVRVEKVDGKTGFGIRITDSRLERRDKRSRTSADRAPPSLQERRRSSGS